MANELHFPLFHGYVDRWLVSGVTETPVITSPRPCTVPKTKS